VTAHLHKTIALDENWLDRMVDTSRNIPTDNEVSGISKQFMHYLEQSEFDTCIAAVCGFSEIISLSLVYELNLS
jgi:hypothetical protein